MNIMSEANCRAPIRTSLACALSIVAIGLLAAAPSFAQEQSAAAASQAPVPGTTGLEEVIVTAQKREESAKDVPLTMVVFDGATLEQAGLTDLNDYAKFVPGLIYNSPGNGERSGPDIAIRGVANSRLGDFETNIGTATTGYAYGDLPTYAFNPELIDIQRIEVLEGPQGTLYGAAAMGGLIKVVPNLPDFTDFYGKAEAGISTLDSGWGAGDNGYKASAYVNVPLSDIFAFRFSFHTSTDPGYIDVHMMTGSPHDQYGPNGLVAFNSLQSNSYGAGGEFLKNVNQNTSGGGRMALRFKPNENFDATLAFMYDSQVENSFPNYEPVLSTSAAPTVADQFQLQPQNIGYSLASLDMAYNFGFATLHSITGWIDRKFTDSEDFAGITYGSLGGNGVVPLPTPAPVTFTLNTKLISQELRLQGEQKNILWQGSGINWTVGGFYQQEKRNAFGDVTVGGAWLDEAQAPLTAPPSGTTEVWAGEYISTYTDKAEFADVTINLLPNLSISGGVRHSTQDVDSTRTDFSDVFAGAAPMGNIVIHEPVHESKSVPRATITYAVTKDINVYGTYSEGFRIGGFNPIGNLSTPGCLPALAKFGITDPAAAAEFKSDQIRNLEAGIKTDLFDGRVIANLSVFRVDWTDLQTTIALDQYASGCGASFVANAGAARINGAEGELRAALDQHWQVSLSGQYADGKIVEVVPGGTGTLGAPLESTPKAQVTAGVIYKFFPRPTWAANARADYAYVGARNLSNTNTPVDPNYQLPGYGEVNLRFSVNHENWEYSTYVSNLTNTVPQLGIYIFSGGPGNYQGAFAPGEQRFITTSPPRTFGITFKRSF
jgi:iron complex outermembrane receptor protein